MCGSAEFEFAAERGDTVFDFLEHDDSGLAFHLSEGLQEDGAVFFDVAEAFDELCIIFVAFEEVAEVLDGAIEVSGDIECL